MCCTVDIRYKYFENFVPFRTLYLEETRLAPSSAVDKVTANGLTGRHAGNSRKWQKVLCGVKKNCQSHKLIFTQNNFLDFKILAA